MPTIREILEVIAPIKFIGEQSTEIRELVRLDLPPTRADQIFWCKNSLLSNLRNISGGTVICGQGVEELPLQSHLNYIVVHNPRSAYLKIAGRFFMPAQDPPTVHPTAIIDPSAKIGQHVSVGAHVVVERGCVIGDHSRIGANTILYHDTIIGNNVTIGANCTIGGVGFGYELNEEGIYEAIPHLGNVVINDFVEIGNNTAIDRAALGSTLIHEHVKIDNLVHVAHGVKIGRNSLLIAHCMIGGSTEIGEKVWVAPSASLMNGISVGSDSVLGMGSVVTKPVAAGDVVVGNPGKVLRNKFKDTK